MSATHSGFGEIVEPNWRLAARDASVRPNAATENGAFELGRFRCRLRIKCAQSAAAYDRILGAFLTADLLPFAPIFGGNGFNTRAAERAGCFEVRPAEGCDDTNCTARTSRNPIKNVSAM